LLLRRTTGFCLQANPNIMAERIDAHHHLWRYQAADYSWINDSMSVLKRDFLPQDLEKELHAEGFSGSVAVQASQTLAETTWLLELATKFPAIRGVIGWAPLASDHFAADLEHLHSQSKLKGFRHVVQDEPDDNFILGSNFNRGVSSLKNTGLVYDILIFERHLPASIQFVDRHPGQLFVLDHIAKPKIRERLMDPWSKNIGELARRENVFFRHGNRGGLGKLDGGGPETVRGRSTGGIRSQEADGGIRLARLPACQHLQEMVRCAEKLTWGSFRLRT
jgi:predicted TIM-barrel fold metal-dependent hydrolase